MQGLLLEMPFLSSQPGNTNHERPICFSYVVKSPCTETPEGEGAIILPELSSTCGLSELWSIMSVLALQISVEDCQSSHTMHGKAALAEEFLCFHHSISLQVTSAK